MSNAIWAIPGLMPPQSPNYDRNIILPENGGCSICIHCGVDTDVVTYSLVLPGIDGGVILDPTYDTGDAEEVAERIAKYQQFVTKSSVLPADTYVPRKKLAFGRTVPITEHPEINEVDLRYWLLHLPDFLLPVGDTTIEVVVNGVVTKYIVQRPESVRGQYWDITPKIEE